MSFLSELKRRNVFKVGVAYVIVAWLLIQIADVLFPTFQAPDWAMRVFTLFVFLGFPLAIFLAWAFDLTPEGIKSTQTVTPTESIAQAAGQRLNYTILGLVVVAVVFLLWEKFVPEDEPGTMTASSVAGPVSTATTGEMEVTPSKATPASSVAPDTGRVRRSNLFLGSTQPFSFLGIRTVIALSPDGDNLVYGLYENGGSQLYHRALNQLTARALPATGINPIFSPDGEWVAYGYNNVLYKVSIVGGSPQTLAEDINQQDGYYWSEKDVIYFIQGRILHSIAATGGIPEPVNITSEHWAWYHYWPYGLPGGTHLLFSVSQGNASQALIALLSLDTGETQILVQN